MANPNPILQSGSIISNNGISNTNVALSTFIIISVAGNPVGAIQDLTIDESRPIQLMSEIGSDGMIDSAPNQSTTISGSCTRIRYNLMRITSAFGRDFIHISSQRLPFDIQIFDNWNGAGSNSVITTIENVWIEKLGYSYKSDNWMIVDNMSFKAERVYSTLNGSAASTSGNRGFPLQIDPIEQQADQGLVIGGVTIGGLINELFQ